ncbi:DGQHR domain-containing protein [Ferruginibacter albus]|uniref:DGQHR domain-containing protein n=1 Tax=Ferruginibacter albus TaxID=2875540 RepID=UPI001CC34B7B|nr:DGQHR domain-containing protein [Ferruginibacter albus]UAY51282.1 DGQHR domain-containing protein [Ferruginibacter albus]
MKEEAKIALFNKLIMESDIAKAISIRKSDLYKESFPNNSPYIEERKKHGWEIDSILKTVTRLTKPKPNDVSFEDKTWTLFALLGFKIMNKDRHLHLPYDKSNPSLTQQIDVFAKDDETVLLIECRSATSNKIGDFKKELEAMKSKKQGLINSVRALFPNFSPKFKYILATRNLSISDADKARLLSIKGIHFSEEIIDYYYSLFSQIGLSARYQLLGSLFAGEPIPDLDNIIPAIEGKMGGYTYYSFSIEPEKLLKIGYILHRNKANEDMMPTYQRIIKKARLKEIHNFIDEEKGFFPNSIIVNILSDRNKNIKFERSSLQAPNSLSRIGILHLPKKYQSAYIIDGQHRLYGYSNSMYKSSNTIPVVAFVDLEKTEQVKMFMQINENQKPVSKDLRNTLDSDLLWDSESFLDQMRALKSRIAITLGESRRSPLFGKISIGEDKKIISTQQISIALSKSDFLGKVKKFEIEKIGTFYAGDIEKAFTKITDLLIRTFDYIKNHLEELWEKENNIIVLNKGIYGIILILNDIINYLFEEKVISDITSTKQVHEETQVYLNTLIHFFKDISEEKENELKNAYGAGGDAKYWRTLQKAMKEIHSEINYEGLEEFLKKEDKENNEEAFKYIREIELYLKASVRERLETEFGKGWFKKGVPIKIYTDATTIAAQKNREIENEEDEKDPWDCLHLINYRDIIVQNWQKIFEKNYTIPGEEKISGGKEAKTKWLVELNRIRNENDHTYYVTSDELSFIEKIYDWLIK